MSDPIFESLRTQSWQIKKTVEETKFRLQRLLASKCPRGRLIQLNPKLLTRYV